MILKFRDEIYPELGLQGQRAHDARTLKHGGRCQHCGALHGSIVFRSKFDPLDFCEIAISPDAPSAKRPFRNVLADYWPEVLAELDSWESATQQAEVQEAILPDGDRSALCQTCRRHFRASLLTPRISTEGGQMALFDAESLLAGGSA